MPDQTNSPDFFVCRGCSCLCDDISADDAGGPDLADETVCEQGRLFWSQREVQPGCFVDSKPVTFEQALQAAVDTLLRSKAPLICGLEGLSTQAQQSVWKLNDLIRGTIDIGLSNTGRGKMLAMQSVGSVTGTLGEVANRADLILYWNCNPLVSHPRHLQRFARPANRDSKFVMVINAGPHQTAAQADFFLPLDRSKAVSAIAVLRHGLRMLSHRSHEIELHDLSRAEVWQNVAMITEHQVQETTGHPIAVWAQILTRLLTSKYGVWFCGSSDQPSDTDAESQGLAQLIRELNDHTRFIHLPLRQDANAGSAENVLAWSSGYPFAVNCNLGYPRFNGLEYSALNLIEREECDLILLGSTELLDRQLANMNDRAMSNLQSIPKIIFRETESLANIPLNNVVAEFRVAKIGFSDTGDFCRMDGVSLNIPATTAKADIPAAKSVFEKFYQRYFSERQQEAL